ncbi:MAG: GYD domain-containing protein [Candidatus Bathyarchaeota archaeon]|nr:MAG: GYD domain-containing protein [Candidatus Bathyarchaeota archaeon]
MFFIVLVKWKQAPKKEIIDKATKMLEELAKQGIKMRVYWTMGRYDAVTFIEAPNEKVATKTILRFQGIVDTETMVAIPREEAIKLL